MSKNFVTFHIVNDIPWSNLNRDDTGTPKRTVLGGVERGMLSSQSIKRAIRKDYESRILKVQPDLSIEIPKEEKEEASSQASIRSRYTVEWVLRRAEKLAEEQNIAFDTKKARTLANGIVKKLVGGEDTIIWLSIEELEAFAQVLLEDKNLGSSDKDKAILDDFMLNGRSGALAIAAFGRMFANASNKNTDAAISVSPAISTHENLIETDYFIAADDFGFFSKDKTTKKVSENYEGAGAAHLGLSLYTSGVFYRTVTIDINDLIKNWTGATSEYAEESLRQLVISIVNSLPTGKKNHTAPYTLVPLIIAETQNYREAYSIADPVELPENGGFLGSTVEAIAKQHQQARRFNSSNYGDYRISGRFAEVLTDTPSSIDEVVDFVVQKIINAVPKEETTESLEDTELFVKEDLYNESTRTTVEPTEPTEQSISDQLNS